MIPQKRLLSRLFMFAVLFLGFLQRLLHIYAGYQGFIQRYDKMLDENPEATEVLLNVSAIYATGDR